MGKKGQVSLTQRKVLAQIFFPTPFCPEPPLTPLSTVSHSSFALHAMVWATWAVRHLFCLFPLQKRGQPFRGLLLSSALFSDQRRIVVHMEERMEAAHEPQPCAHACSSRGHGAVSTEYSRLSSCEQRH